MKNKYIITKFLFLEALSKTLSHNTFFNIIIFLSFSGCSSLSFCDLYQSSDRVIVSMTRLGCGRDGDGRKLREDGEQ